MHTFLDYARTFSLATRLGLLENFYPIKADTYDGLFNAELLALLERIPDPRLRGELEGMKDFRWTNYLMTSVRRSSEMAGEREIDERTHDLAAKLLLGGLFSGYDPARHGPFSARFKTAVANGIRNQVAKVRSRQRHIPSVHIGHDSGGVRPDHIAGRTWAGNENAIDDFRRLVQSRLGSLGLAVLDLRLSGEADTKSLVGSPDHGSPTSYRIKQTVQAIKGLAQEFARAKGDTELLWRINRAMEAEQETADKRFSANIL